MFGGADPGIGWKMTDPIYTPKPTLGACMPNIRRSVMEGDFIFSISGRAEGVKQFIVGGFEVEEKMNALEAYSRLPQNRMKLNDDGSISGNIIVDAKGNPLPFDYHTNHEKRIENYIIGRNPIFFEKPKEIELAREDSVRVLQQIFNNKEDTVSKIIGRWRKLEKGQINELTSWMSEIKGKF